MIAEQETLLTEARYKPLVWGDAAIGLTTNSNSANVVAGIAEAKRRRASTVAFAGNGGRAADVSDGIVTADAKESGETLLSVKR